MDIARDRLFWFALATSYQREMRLKTFFDSREVTSYVPSREDYVEDKDNPGMPKRVDVPLIHNLIFVRSTYDEMAAYKKLLTDDGIPFRWMMDYAQDNRPIIIPDAEMDAFIDLCSRPFSRVLTPEQMAKVKRDTYVEILAGPFNGVRGYYCRPLSQKCVVIELEGLVGACTTYVPVTSLKILEEQPRID